MDPRDLTREARRARSNVISAYASKFAPYSLDKKVCDDNERTLADLLPDDGASRWLEEMGATVW
jgi:hypothetical protein